MLLKAGMLRKAAEVFGVLREAAGSLDAFKKLICCAKLLKSYWNAA
jgi:hypothetical protein